MCLVPSEHKLGWRILRMMWNSSTGISAISVERIACIIVVNVSLSTIKICIFSFTLLAVLITLKIGIESFYDISAQTCENW